MGYNRSNQVAVHLSPSTPTITITIITYTYVFHAMGSTNCLMSSHRGLHFTTRIVHFLVSGLATCPIHRH